MCLKKTTTKHRLEQLEQNLDLKDRINLLLIITLKIQLLPITLVPVD